MDVVVDGFSLRATDELIAAVRHGAPQTDLRAVPLTERDHFLARAVLQEADRERVDVVRTAEASYRDRQRAQEKLAALSKDTTLDLLVGEEASEMLASGSGAGLSNPRCRIERSALASCLATKPGGSDALTAECGRLVNAFLSCASRGKGQE